MTEKEWPDTTVDRLAMQLVSDLLETTDEEILAELADGSTLDSILVSVQNDLAAAKMQIGKARMAEARSALQTRRTSRRRPSYAVLSTQTMRQRLINLAQSHGMGDRLTLAARNGSSIPDADLEGILDDLLDLGVNLDDFSEEE